MTTITRDKGFVMADVYAKAAGVTLYSLYRELKRTVEEWKDFDVNTKEVLPMNLTEVGLMNLRFCPAACVRALEFINLNAKTRKIDKNLMNAKDNIIMMLFENLQAKDPDYWNGIWEDGIKDIIEPDYSEL